VTRIIKLTIIPMALLDISAGFLGMI